MSAKALARILYMLHRTFVPRSPSTAVQQLQSGTARSRYDGAIGHAPPARAVGEGDRGAAGLVRHVDQLAGRRSGGYAGDGVGSDAHRAIDIELRAGAGKAESDAA